MPAGMPCAPFRGSILGVGIDLVDGNRLQRVLARTPRLMHRVFTSSEQAYAHSQHHPHMALAKRFAAKEAFAKAAGCGIGSLLSWTDIRVERHPTGQPFIVLPPSVYQALCRHLGGLFQVVCSLTDQKLASSNVAQAFVIIQRTA